jgi:hypothetical protein
MDGKRNSDDARTPDAPKKRQATDVPNPLEPRTIRPPAPDRRVQWPRRFDDLFFDP